MLPYPTPLAPDENIAVPTCLYTEVLEKVSSCFKTSLKKTIAGRQVFALGKFYL